MFQVLQPPSDEAKFAEIGKEIFAAAKDLGMNLAVEGFLQAWVSGTRVVVRRDNEGRIDSLLLLAVGVQWNRNETTASVLEARGDIPGLIEFAKQMAAAMGASRLYVPTDDYLPRLAALVIEQYTQHKEIPDEAKVAESIDAVFKLHFPMQRMNGILEFILK